MSQQLPRGRVRSPWLALGIGLVLAQALLAGCGGSAAVDMGVAASCNDGKKNGSETDVDCGGTCAGCEDGKACKVSGDCQVLHCEAGVCMLPKPTSCSDGTRNGDESDVDCGGSCAGCADGKACGYPEDCAGGMCDAGKCSTPPPSCTDRRKNQDETDIDCGGKKCLPCGDGKHCGLAGDCASQVCAAGTCAVPTCTDGQKNGGESDIDCGGPCVRCADHKHCQLAADCVSTVCSQGSCAAASCTDGVQNEGEGDVDCGGPCAACGDGRSCARASDCKSLVCAQMACAIASCNDLVKNGSETDVDCGGAFCPACDIGRACAANSDCHSDRCAKNLCAVFSPMFGAAALHPVHAAAAGTRILSSDFDGDGRADLATLSQANDASLDVLLAASSFAATALAVGGTAPLDFALADWNLDGKRDVLLALAAPAGFTLGLGRGDGTFPALGVSVVRAVPGPFGLAAPDLDGDGKPDLCTTTTGGTTVTCQRGNGAGAFQPPQSFGAGGTAELILAADLDRDGNVDLLVAERASGALRVLRGDGKGQLAPIALSQPMLPNLAGLALADLNLDGIVDVVATTASCGPMSVALGAGDGSFHAFTSIAASCTRWPGIGDIDLDGAPDLVADDTQASLVVLYGDGKAGFGRKLPLGFAAPVSGAVVVDLNGDGRPDIAGVSNTRSEVGVFLDLAP